MVNSSIRKNVLDVIYKEFVAQHLTGHTVRFICDCIIRLDVTGVVTGYEMNGSEIVYIVDTGDRRVKIGENTPKLEVEVQH